MGWTTVPTDSQNSLEEVLLATTHIRTYWGSQHLTNASGFFFQRDARLFLVTSLHVLQDQLTRHLPDRIEIELHTCANDLSRIAIFSIPLFSQGAELWTRASDTAGSVDIAAIEIAVDRLPEQTLLRAFNVSNLDAGSEDVAIGDDLTVVGFPLGFHDTVHYLAVARSASIASAYGVRFQRQGYFLTDARTHRGSSGSPVLRRRRTAHSARSLDAWQLLGVHSTRMDMRTRDVIEDESLGLNCTWYTDVLLLLTA